MRQKEEQGGEINTAVQRQNLLCSFSVDFLGAENRNIGCFAFVRQNSTYSTKSPPWPSGIKRWNQTLVPVVRARFEPRCGRPHFAPTRSGVRVCGRNRTETREREWEEGTVSSLPGTLNVRIKFCHSTGIALSGGGGQGQHNKLCLVKALIPRIRPSKHSN